MEEIWKDIYFEENGVIWDYRGLYQVSNFGRIKSFNYNNNTIIRKLNFNKQGYVYIMLQKNKKKKMFRVHRLVAHMFIPNPENLPEVNHKDENKENNNVNNLEWCTHEYNNNYGTKNERHSKKISGENNYWYNKLGGEHGSSIKINQYDKQLNLIKQWNSIMDIERELGFNHTNISKCCKWYECNNNLDKWYENHTGSPLKTYKGFIWKYYKEIE